MKEIIIYVLIAVISLLVIVFSNSYLQSKCRAAGGQTIVYSAKLGCVLPAVK